MDRLFAAGLIVAWLFSPCVWGIPMTFKDLGLKDRVRKMPRTWIPGDPKCFPTKCPAPGSAEWNKLNDHCCQDPLMYYHCQKLENGRMLRFCMDLVECPAGTFADMEVIRDRRYFAERLCQPCPPKEFQPDPTYSVLFNIPRCHYRRRNCPDLGAEIVVPGSPVADDVCMCPYYHGYRPSGLLVPAQECHTFNSSSGCGCTYMPCPAGHIMTDGYECMRSNLATPMETFDLREANNKILKEAVGNEYPHFCLGKDCPDVSPEASWLIFFQDMYRSHGLWITGLLAFVVVSVVYCVYKLYRYWRSGPTTYDILVCITIPSSKICEFVFEEINNSLPLLERLYGPLALDHDSDFTYITVVVRPALAKVKFSLTQFIRDLFGAVSIAKYLNGTSEGIRIVAVHGTSSEVRTASFKEVALKHTDQVAFNAGKVILRFSDELVEDRLIREVKTAKRDFKTIFRLYKLKFGSIKRGSIDFTYTFTESESFDSMAMEQKINKLVKDLCTNDSFKQLAKREDVRVEFICKAKLGTVSVVQAQNLCIQIGMQNNVYIRNQQPQPLDENDQDDFLEFDEDRPGCLFSYNIVSMSPRNLAIHGAGEGTGQQEREDNAEPGLDPNSRVIPVVVKCDATTADRLHAEWSNHLPLLKRIYPSCRMRRTDSGVVWELDSSVPRGQDGYPDVTAFVDDLFLTARVKEIRSASDVNVNVHVSRHTAGIVALSRKVIKDKVMEKEMDKEISNLFAYFVFLLTLLVFIFTTSNNEEFNLLQSILLLVYFVCFIRHCFPCVLKIIILGWKLRVAREVLKLIIGCMIIYIIWF